METNSKYFLPAAVIFAGLFIGGAIIWNNFHPVATGSGGVAGTGAAGTGVDIKDVNTAGEPFIGDANAPVTIAFWSDFQCPYCKSFETGGVPQITTPAALPTIIKNYVDTGKARVVFKDFAFLGNDSITAAEYGRAVWKLYPEQYFAWRTAMYNAQDQEGDQGFGNTSSIDKLDTTIKGLDAAKIAADVTLNKATYDAAAEANKAEGATLGINATPSFIIGTKLIQGARPYSAFQPIIDALLK